MRKAARVGLFAMLVSAANGATAEPSPSAAAWHGARPAVTLELEPGIEPGGYRVQALVTDLRDGAVLARPQLTVEAGAPAVIELGDAAGVMLRLEVAVDATRTRATWLFRLLDRGVVQSEQRATLTLAPPDEAAY